MTRFYHGAITPQSVEWLTADELREYIDQMKAAHREMHRQQKR